MATDITINTTKSMLSIVVDKADYPSATYPDFIDIPIPTLSMYKGETTAPLIINGYLFDTALGTINVAASPMASTAVLRTTILSLV